MFIKDVYKRQEGRSQVARDKNKKKEVVDFDKNCLNKLNVMRLKNLK